jgi:hypothetical protein
MSALSSFSTARTSEAQAARSKVSRHLPVSLYVTGVPGLGIAIAARTWTAPREAEAGVTLPVTAERRRTTLEKRAGASATGAARVMAAMISLKLGEGGSATRECDGALAVRKVARARTAARSPNRDVSTPAVETRGPSPGISTSHEPGRRPKNRSHRERFFESLGIRGTQAEHDAGRDF